MTEAGLEDDDPLQGSDKVVAAAGRKKWEFPQCTELIDKVTTLRNLLKDRQIPTENVVYVGNDTNESGMLPLGGYAVAVGRCPA